MYNNKEIKYLLKKTNMEKKTNTQDNYLNEEYNKFILVITKEQYIISLNELSTHEKMIENIITKIRPDLKNRKDNINEQFTDSNIIIVGYPYHIIIELPNKEMLSKEQYMCLKKILLEIKKYNDKQDKYNKYELIIFDNEIIKIKGIYCEEKILEVISQLKKYINNKYQIKEEKIVGTPIKKRRNNNNQNNNRN